MVANDDTVIGFGMYKGEKLGNIPARYLLFIYENNKCPNDIREYVKENKELLEDEAKKSPFQKSKFN